MPERGHCLPRRSPLILRDEIVFGVRILDTTQIHVEAAVARLISAS